MERRSFERKHGGKMQLLEVKKCVALIESHQWLVQTEFPTAASRTETAAGDDRMPSPQSSDGVASGFENEWESFGHAETAVQTCATAIRPFLPSILRHCYAGPILRHVIRKSISACAVKY